MTASPAGKQAGAKSSSFMNKMRAKLSGGQFRMLNEKLYTTTGDEGLDLVKNAPELFEAYHAGFRAQVESWPTKPVDVVAALLKRSPKSWIVADFGCGDAELGRLIEQNATRSIYKRRNPRPRSSRVTCRTFSRPAYVGGRRAGVFALSLMGTDYGSFLEEAHRVLKPGGLLWIAEVRSRFDGKNGTASVACARRRSRRPRFGFKRKRDVDERNTMFFTAEFIKTWVSKGKHSNTSTHRAVRWPDAQGVHVQAPVNIRVSSSRPDGDSRVTDPVHRHTPTRPSRAPRAPHAAGVDMSRVSTLARRLSRVASRARAVSPMPSEWIPLSITATSSTRLPATRATRDASTTSSAASAASLLDAARARACPRIYVEWACASWTATASRASASPRGGSCLWARSTMIRAS